MSGMTAPVGFSLLWLLILFYLAIFAEYRVIKGGSLDGLKRTIRFFSRLALLCIAAGILLALGVLDVHRSVGVELAVSSGLFQVILKVVGEIIDSR